MRKYNSKAELVGEIVKRAELFIGEFSDISDGQKDIVIDGVDRTPAQMIAYQLGWMHLLIEWEEKEQRGEVVLTPSDEFKWNNLGGLYGKFYSQYEGYTIDQLRAAFRFTVERVVDLVYSLSDDDLFNPDSRQWAASTPSNWPVWKWVHINTVAPFGSFRAKMRKWKRLANASSD